MTDIVYELSFAGIYITIGSVGTYLVMKVREERAKQKASNARFEREIAPYRLLEVASHRRRRGQPTALPAARARSWDALDEGNAGRWPGSPAAAPAVGTSRVDVPWHERVWLANRVFPHAEDVADTGLIPAVEDAGRLS